MTALVMQKLATSLLNEGFVVKKIEDEQVSSFSRSGSDVEYTGQIVIVARSLDDEVAERLRKTKEREKASGVTALHESEEIPL